MGHGVIGWVYPSLCRECSVFIPKNSVFCVSCLKNITPVASISCDGITVFALSRYEGAIKKLVLRKKRALFQLSGDKVASRQLGQLLHDFTPVREMHSAGGIIPLDYIIPIPLHWTRYLWRGFNQSYEMGRVLSRRMGVPIICPLRRIKRTCFQSNLSGKQREENVKNIFVLKNKYDLKEKNILLIDDLYTTGATLRNAVRPLVACGVKKIAAAVACRV